jgi:putative nucleotidyltransferase with HDIG domain
VSPLSLMSQTFAQRAFVVFFLASVVPLAFLAFLGHEYIEPQLGSAVAANALQVAIVLTAVLAILSFYVLSRAARETTEEMSARNQKLQTLVRASQSLAEGGFVDTIGHETLSAATRLVAAPSSLLFLAPGPAGGQPPEPLCSDPGAERVLRERVEPLGQIVAQLDEARSGLLVDERSAAAGLLGEVPGFGRVGSAIAVPLLAQSEAFGALVCLRRGGEAPFDPAELELLGSLGRQAGVAIHGARLQESEKNFFTHVTGLLVEAVDRFVVQQAGHSKRVAYYCSALARELGLDAARRERLFFAALLHDIGMLRIPKLGVAGCEHYVEHSRLGYEMVRSITLWSDLAPFVLHHHERWDGKGYPDGLAGEAIPLESRILALADAFEAMTSPSSYRPWRPMDEALREIEQLAGAQFDPEAAKALLALAARGELEMPSSS